MEVEERYYRRVCDAFKGSKWDGRGWVMDHHLNGDKAWLRPLPELWSPNAPLISRRLPEQPNSLKRALCWILCLKSPSNGVAIHPRPDEFSLSLPPRSNDFFQCFHSSLYKHNCILTLLFSVFFLRFRIFEPVLVSCGGKSGQNERFCYVRWEWIQIMMEGRF